MNEYSDAVASLQQAQASTRRLTLREQTEDQLNQAKQEVLRIEELLDLMDRNPEIQRILELLGRKY